MSWKLKQGVISLCVQVWFNMEFSCDAAEEERQKIHNHSRAVGWKSAGDSLGKPQSSQHIIKVGNMFSCCLEKQLQESQRDKKFNAALSGSLSEAPVFSKAPLSVWQMEVKWVMGAAGCSSPSSCQSERRAAFPCTYMFPLTDEGAAEHQRHSSHWHHFLSGVSAGRDTVTRLRLILTVSWCSYVLI